MQDARTHQHAKVQWSDGVPVSARFDDPYYSLQDGLAETHHVFVAGNRLTDRICDGFHIAELGVGTGLNLLVAFALAAQNNTALRYTGFEAYPMARDDMAQALSPFRDALGAALVDTFLEAWSESGGEIALPAGTAQILVGDARQRLPEWPGRADAWFLDGFSPAKNPELWEPALLHEVGRHTAPNGTFATYTAAGAVRRALDAAGFAVTRVPGFGRKRHMSIGVLRPA